MRQIGVSRILFFEFFYKGVEKGGIVLLAWTIRETGMESLKTHYFVIIGRDPMIHLTEYR